MIFGEPLNPDNPDIIILPREWGRQNESSIALWFQMDKLTVAHKVELGMTRPANYPDKDPSDDNEHHDC
jgi:hypothetical protein